MWYVFEMHIGQLLCSSIVASKKKNEKHRRKRRQVNTGMSVRIILLVFKVNQLSFSIIIGCSRIIDLTPTTQYTSITSPNYPNLYPTNVQCYYYIRAPQTYRVLLQFTDFNIPTYNRNSCDDSVEIRYYHLGKFLFFFSFSLVISFYFDIAFLLKDNRVQHTVEQVLIPIIYNLLVQKITS